MLPSSWSGEEAAEEVESDNESDGSDESEDEGDDDENGDNNHEASLGKSSACLFIFNVKSWIIGFQWPPADGLNDTVIRLAGRLKARYTAYVWQDPVRHNTEMG